MKHYSVLKSEALDALNIQPDGIYIDATLGYGGHAEIILKALTTGTLIGIDRDEEAINYSTEKLSKISNQFKIIHSDFAQMKEKLSEVGITEVDGILFDLGVSSPQIDSESRGFSFMREEPLDMRMDQSETKSAETIVNDYSFEKLKEIFFQYGEEKMSSNIAKKITEKRKEKRITKTTELVQIIESAVGANYFYKNHPERQIFQAIRIEVNNELKDIETVLPDAIHLLKKGGRISVITFHSLEDRIVKTVFRKYSEIEPLVKGLPEIPYKYLPEIKLVNKKPILPDKKELEENSRSRSAKLRVIERIKENEKTK